MPRLAESEPPVQRACRLAAALGDLTLQGEGLARSGDYGALPPLLERCAPLVDELCRLAPLLGADASEIRAKVEDVRLLWTRQAQGLQEASRQVASELDSVRQGMRRVRSLRPSYAPSAGPSDGIGAALCSRA